MAAQANPAHDPNDYLGYGDYAQSLWTRIEAALAKDEGNKPLGDDPLVVGIFGEWGAGKSKLLDLIFKKATADGNQAASWRAMGFADANGKKAVTLTVPVFFQPWKYEHERHLHVPLLLHILEALKTSLKAGQTPLEQLQQDLGKAGDGLVSAAAQITPHFEKIFRAVVAGMDLGVTGGAATAGFSVVIWLAEKLKSGQKKPKDIPATIKYTDEGRYYYEIHQALKNITRPGKKTDYAQGIHLKHDIRINFVVFIDDLDRCLPENAVGTLELIKTIFNVESFAFVLALDDEVIERGIGHRYQAYNFAGKKPEMPITGFEYLEKIVHLPFRLPPLTPEKAQHFVKQYETATQKNPELHWFSPLKLDGSYKIPGHVRGMNEADPALIGSDGLAELRRIPGEDQIELWPLVRDSFDAYVPRKLIRLVELLNQTAAIANMRGSTLSLGRSGSGKIDVRVVLALILIQLFQPELYRLMRRHKSVFPFLLSAFASGKFSTSQVSDIDLWRWAVGETYQKPRRHLPAQASLTPLQDALNQISAIDKPADQAVTLRADAQQIRLPLVLQLIEHRAAQRHVFDVLKLMQRLAAELGENAANVNISDYFSLLGNEPETPMVTPQAGEPDLRPRHTVLEVQRLFNDWVSSEPAAVTNIVSRNEIPAGHVLAKESVDALLALVRGWTMADNDNAKLLKGLQNLAPHLAKDDAPQFWDLVKTTAIFPIQEPNSLTQDPKLTAQYADVKHALGLDDRFDAKRFYLLKDSQRFNGNDERTEPIPGFVLIDGKEPLHKPFYIARTLTTVDQYAAFIAAGGYDEANKAWWDKQGWALQIKKGEDDRNQPWKWDEQHTFGNRPVHRVTWFEARAYARWLTAQLPGYTACLPTEAQWARAAYPMNAKPGADDMWPWGNDKTNASKRANIQDTGIGVKDTGIGEASAVGCFAPNHLGICDLAGNLWEWQDNVYAADGAEASRIAKDADFEKLDDWKDNKNTPALRGGAWNLTADFARCGIRYGGLPDFRFDNVGFRVVLSLAN